MEPIEIVIKTERLEWFGHVKRRLETENSKVDDEMKV